VPFYIFFDIKLIGVISDTILNANGVIHFFRLGLFLVSLGNLNPRAALISTSYCTGSVNTRVLTLRTNGMVKVSARDIYYLRVLIFMLRTNSPFIFLFKLIVINLFNFEYVPYNFKLYS